MIGAIGDDTYTGETILSGVVKQIYKLRDLAQRFRCPVLVSEFVIQTESEHYEKRLLGYFFNNDSSRTAFYEIFTESSEKTILKKESRKNFETAIDYYYDYQFDEACVCFNKVLKVSPEDPAALWYRDESIKYQKIPPEGKELI